MTAVRVGKMSFEATHSHTHSDEISFSEVDVERVYLLDLFPTYCFPDISKHVKLSLLS